MPFEPTREAAISLVVFRSVYLFIFSFGVLYIYRLLRAGPLGSLALPPKPRSPAVRWAISKVVAWITGRSRAVMLSYSSDPSPGPCKDDFRQQRPAEQVSKLQAGDGDADILVISYC